MNETRPIGQGTVVLGALLLCLAGLSIALARTTLAPEPLSPKDSVLVTAAGQVLSDAQPGAVRVRAGMSPCTGCPKNDSITIASTIPSAPSLRPFGFLNDEIRRYNRWQRERQKGNEAANPTLLRVVHAGDGAVRLTTSPPTSQRDAATGEPVRWTGDIRARDWWEGLALVGQDKLVPLDRTTRVLVADRGTTHPCDFVVQERAVSIFCASEQRIPQAILHRHSQDDDALWLIAGYDRPWVDGVRPESGDSVILHPGALLMLDPLGPLVLAKAETGLLSRSGWRSGTRARFLTPDDESPFGQLIRDVHVGHAGAGELQLGIDVELTSDLQRGLERFLMEWQGPPIEEAQVVVLGVPSGELLALAGIRPGGFKDRVLFDRIAPGSAVKPLIASAILSRRPILGTLRIRASVGKLTSILGMPQIQEAQAFDSHLNCPVDASGWIDLEYFLRCSNNAYAASLLLLGLDHEAPGKSVALTEAAVDAPFQLGGQQWTGKRPDVVLLGLTVPRETLLRSATAEGVAGLFDLSIDPEIVHRAGEFVDVIEPDATLTDGARSTVTTRAFSARSAPVLLAPTSPSGTSLAYLYRYAIGAWENRWNLADLTQAFSRVTSDRRVTLRVSSRPPGAPPVPPLGLAQAPWYPHLLQGLAGVAQTGTAHGLATVMLHGLPNEARLYAKTGTLAEEATTPSDDNDLYTKTLLLSLGIPGESGALRCGVSVGIYVRFGPETKTGSHLPNAAVNYSTDVLGPALRDTWSRLVPSSCEQ